MKILVVDDDPRLREVVTIALERAAFSVVTAADGQRALTHAAREAPDLIVLDIGLPEIDGLEVCRRLRARSDVPVIFLTARDDEIDRVVGLELGADDYVTKPFSVAQLVLRVKAVLRRTNAGSETAHLIRLGDYCTVDCLNLSGQAGGETLAFTRREVDMLQYLSANSARPVSREELLTKVWGYAKNLGLETRTVDIHIAKLRRKLEPDPGQPRFLVTIRGAGYRLQTDD